MCIRDRCGRGHRCTAVVADVRDPASVAAAIKRAKEKEGRIDILVNNAGVCRLGSFLDMSDDDRDFHIDINIKGCLLYTSGESVSGIGLALVVADIVALIWLLTNRRLRACFNEEKE